MVMFMICLKFHSLLLSRNDKNTKELKRINPSIIRKIMRIIHENGSINSTWESNTIIHQKLVFDHLIK